jgi:hypothetical protein
VLPASSPQWSTEAAPATVSTDPVTGRDGAAHHARAQWHGNRHDSRGLSQTRQRDTTEAVSDTAQLPRGRGRAGSCVGSGRVGRTAAVRLMEVKRDQLLDVTQTPAIVLVQLFLQTLPLHSEHHSTAQHSTSHQDSAQRTMRVLCRAAVTDMGGHFPFGTAETLILGGQFHETKRIVSTQIADCRVGEQTRIADCRPGTCIRKEGSSQRANRRCGLVSERERVRESVRNRLR